MLADPDNRPVLDALAGGGVPDLDDSSYLASVDPALARPILEGFSSSLSLVFALAAAVLVVGLVAVLRMKEVPLRTQSGVEAQRSADRAEAAGSEETAGLPPGGPQPAEPAPASVPGAAAVAGGAVPHPGPTPPRSPSR